MDKSVLKSVQKTIAGLNPVAFDMGQFAATVEHSCGTSHCIAGWIVVDAGWEVTNDGAGDTLEFTNTVTGETLWADWDDLAAKIAGLTKNQADMLFYMQEPNDSGKVLLSRSDEATPEKSIQAIQNLMDHGDCLWGKLLGP